MDRLLLVDGSNLLFQMFFGMPARILNAEGKPIHGTLGFVGALLKMIRMVQPTHVAVLFDGEHENPRTALDESYKANRSEDLRDSPFSQLEDVYRALDALQICHRETCSCETDDWMAGYTKRYGSRFEIVIASMDSDFFQLIAENVRVLRYRGKSSILCDRAYVRGKFGVEPEQYADFKSLIGDKADNIPGVPGIGPKTAARLLQSFGTLDSVLSQVETIPKPSVRKEILEYRSRLERNRRLITLDGGAALPFPPAELSWQDSGATTVQILKEIGSYGSK